MNSKQLQKLYKVLDEASSLSSISYNLGWLDGKGLKKEGSGVTRKQYARIETRIDNLIRKWKKKVRKMCGTQ